MKYKNKNWRITTSEGLSFNIDRIPFHVEYRTIIGLWRKVPNPEWIGPLCFLAEQDASDWINERSPKSIKPCGKIPVLKPADWNDMQFASGEYGRVKQAEALVRIAKSGC